MGKLDGKVAIVTGASRGIGKAIAQMFAVEGARAVCVARTLNEGEHPLFKGSLNTTVEEIKAAGGEALAVRCNVSEEEECTRLVETARSAYGPIDILVNNAALNYIVPIVDYDVRRWIRAFAVNVHGPFMLSRLVLPDMIQRRSGAILNISSSAARGPGRGPYESPNAGNTLYGACKAALERFTQGLAQEVYQHNVSVTCLAPSAGVPTPGTVYFGFFSSLDDPSGENPQMMARAALLLVATPPDKVTGRVTYSQAILKEFGGIDQASGTGVDRPGSGYSLI